MQDNQELNGAEELDIEFSGADAGSAPAGVTEPETENPSGSQDGEQAEAEQNQDAPEEEAEGDEEERPVNHEAVQKRFNKLTAEKHALKDELERARQEAEEARREIAKLKTVSAEAPKAPNVDLFYTDREEYEKQMAAYVSAQSQHSQATAKLAEEEDRHKRAQDEYAVAQASRLEQVSKDLGLDFATVDKAATVIVDSGMTELFRQSLVEHEVSPALMVHLAKNKALIKELNSISSPLQMARKLDAIADQATQGKVTRAPAPAPRLRGSSASEPDEFDKLGAKLE